MKSKILFLLFLSSVICARLSAQCSANIDYYQYGSSTLVAFWTDSIPTDTATLEAMTTTYTWSFGDGTGGNGNQTSHTFSVPGYSATFDVCITKHDSVLGCTSTTCDTILVYGNHCSAAIGHTITDTLVNFTSVVSGTAPYSYAWTLDGINTGTSSTTAISGILDSTGAVLTACLTMTDATGCVSSICSTVIDTAGGGGSGGGGCNTYPSYSQSDSTYTVSTSSTGVAPYSYNWSINGAFADSTATLTTTILLGASASVCVTVTDAGGCVSYNCIQIYDSTYGGGGGGGGTCSTSIWYSNMDTLYGFSTTNTGTAPYSYSWSVNGIYTDSAQLINLVVALGTGANVCVTVTDSTGCTATNCVYVVDSSAGGTGSCNTSISYTNQGSMYMLSTNNTGTAPYSYSWTVNGVVYGSSPYDTLSLAPGSAYYICVTVTDATGCVSNACIQLGDSCSTYAGYTQTGNTFNFTSSHIGSTPVSYQWTLNGVNVGFADSLSIVLDSSQLVAMASICVTITDAGGCVSSACVTIPSDTTVTTPPCHAYFVIYPDSAMGGSGAYYGYNYSTGSYGSNILWSFGDGDTSSNPYPTHNYATPGVYIVCLTVGVAGTSCYDTYCDSSFYSYKTAQGPMSSLVIIGPEGINNVSSTPTLHVYPNPANSELNISTADKIDEERIFNIEGQVVFESKTGSTKINVSNLNAGIYILELSSAGQVSRTKFVKDL